MNQHSSDCSVMEFTIPEEDECGCVNTRVHPSLLVFFLLRKFFIDELKPFIPCDDYISLLS